MLRGRAARVRADRRESEPDPRAGGLIALGEEFSAIAASLLRGLRDMSLAAL